MHKKSVEKTCPPCRLLVMVGVDGELAEELELLLEKKIFEIFFKISHPVTGKIEKYLYNKWNLNSDKV